MNINEVKIGDLVQLSDEVGTVAQRRIVWRVTEIHRTMISVDPVGGGRGARVNAEHVRLSSPAAAPVGEPYVPREMFTLGEVVEIDSRPGVYYVIIAIKTDSYNAAKLGGDNDRYVRRLLAKQLRKVDISEWRMS